MKATEVIAAYTAGRRDFRGESLRGCNFARLAKKLPNGRRQGVDFSGADFSGCDIRGANFSYANLTKAKLRNTICGYSQFSLIRLLGLLLLLLIFLIFYNSFSNISLKMIEINLDIKEQSFYYQIIRFAQIYILIFYIIFVSPILLITSRKSKNKLTLAGHINKLTFFLFPSIFFLFLVLAYPLIAGKGSLSEIIFILIYLSINFVQIFVFFGIRIVSNIIFNFIVELKPNLALLTSMFFIAVIEIGDYVSNFFIDDEKVGIVTSSVSYIFSMIIVLLVVLIYDPYLFDNSVWNYEVKIAKMIFTRFGTIFRDCNLYGSDFSGAYLKCCNFSNSVISKICLNNSQKAYLSYFGSPPLRSNNVISLMCDLNSGINLDLSHENISNLDLTNAQLENCDLSYANLRGAVLVNANLRGANLTEVNAVQSNFRQATLTGACIENWNIDSSTILNDVDCHYVYLLNGERERRPSSGDFAPGEFTKLFAEVFDTVDLIFREGVDWRALMATLQEVQVQNEDTPLAVQAIENKGDGVFVVKVHVPPDADKPQLHAQFTETYQGQLQAIEAQYQAQLAAKDGQIDVYKEQLAHERQQNTNMMGILNTLASKETKIEIKQVNQDSSQRIDVDGDMTIDADDSTVNLRDLKT